MFGLFDCLRRGLCMVAIVYATVLSLSAQAADESDLLPVDQAFVLSTAVQGADRVEIRWAIADGYYLYRHRISATVVDTGASSAALQLPHGDPHQDEFFGATETYRKRLIAVLPKIANAAGRTLHLRIKYQGCADLGVCYPPQTRTVEVALPAGSSAKGGAIESYVDKGDAGFSALGGTSDGANGRSGNLVPGAITGATEAAPLPEAQAFGFEAIAGDGNTLLLRFTPAKGYYLYRDRTHLTLRANGIVLAPPRWPAGVTHHDEHFGDVVVYFDQADVTVPLLRTRKEAQQVMLGATFQGCQNDGICYPPMTRTIKVALPAGTLSTTTESTTASSTAPTIALPAASATAAVEGSNNNATTQSAASAESGTAKGGDDHVNAATAATSPTASGATLSSADRATATTTDNDRVSSLWAALLLALLGGVVLNLMPCVLPVLSLKALSLVGSGDDPQRARHHALWYTAGVILSFLALGGLAIALREAGLALGWGFQLQQPVVVAALSLLMFMFGLSLSGLWQVGGAWTGVGHTLASRSGPLGDFFTGVLAVVVAAPCTAPFMGPALGWAFTASTGAAMLVFVFLGLGLALPFLLIGFIPALAQRLPKPGAWMETLKQLLAFPMYLTAIWLLWVLAKQRGADAAAWLAITALILSFAAWVWTRASLRGSRPGKTIALVALIAASWPLWTISQLPRINTAGTASTTVQDSVNAQPANMLRSVPFSEQRLADLRKAGRVAFVDMSADWCISCKVNEKNVFGRDGFREQLQAADAVFMVGDWTDVDPAITRYLQRYRAVGVPLYVVYPRGGGEGRVLPTVLTPTVVRNALAEAATATGPGAK